MLLSVIFANNRFLPILHSDPALCSVKNNQACPEPLSNKKQTIVALAAQMYAAGD